MAVSPLVVTDDIKDSAAAQAFTQAMSTLCFEPSPKIAVALSGGGDSMSLAWLAAYWAAQRNGQAIAMVIDHGFQKQSHTKKVAQWAIEMGLVPIIRAVRPRSASQNHARQARYHALDDLCARAGILHLLVGHTQDDQIETITMRDERGSRPWGLAGMSAVREMTSCRLLRPLLNATRAACRDLCQAAGLPWIEDPANHAQRYWRGRHRIQSKEPRDDAFALQRLRTAVQERCRQEEVIGHLASHLRMMPVGRDGPEEMRLERQSLRALILADVARALAVILPWWAGRGHAPSYQAIERGALFCRDGMAGTSMSVAGCVVRLTKQDLIIHRDSRLFQRRAHPLTTAPFVPT
ncbi:MAG: tRNA lysidine(34) synthetase TilS [Pseudomonadota bacterium]